MFTSTARSRKAVTTAVVAYTLLHCVLLNTSSFLLVLNPVHTVRGQMFPGYLALSALLAWVTVSVTLKLLPRHKHKLDVDQLHTVLLLLML